MYDSKLIKVSALVFAAVAVAVHVSRLVVESGALGEAGRLGISASPAFAWLEMLFILCFFCFGFGQWVGKRIGLAISILGLLGVLLGYIWWYAHSRSMLRILAVSAVEHPEIMPPNLMGLIRGTWLDPVILLISVTFLVVQARRLAKVLRLNRAG